MQIKAKAISIMELVDSQMWAHQYDAFDGFDLYFVNVRGQVNLCTKHND